jgi:hypothetical protein
MRLPKRSRSFFWKEKMFTITIRENRGLEALISISDPNFRDDLDLLKGVVPYRDREWKEEERHWVISNPGDYKDAIPQIGTALREHLMQLRFL